MDAVLLVLVVVVVFLAWLVVQYRSPAPANSPPAVKGWPLVGSLFQLDMVRTDKGFARWAKELGPVYSVKLLNKTTVVVSGYDALQEMLITKGQAFAGRGRIFVLDAITFGGRSLLAGDPTMQFWHPMRKTAHRGIRHYGDGLTRLEQTLAVMAHEFVEKVTTYNGRPVDLRDDVHNFVMKVAVTMIVGRKVTDDNDTVLLGMKRLEKLMASLDSGAFLLSVFPFLRHFRVPAIKTVEEICELRNKLWVEIWEETQQSYSTDGDASCIMHSIAQLMDKESQYYEESINMDHAKALFTDLISASVVTTTNFSYCLPSILLHNPRVLKRIQQEVDQIIGHDRQPSIFDRDSMPYSVATIIELLRYAALVSTVPHAALETTTLQGYTIPAGTALMPLFPVVLYDKTFWGDPDKFRPERFLDDKGQLLPPDHPNRKHMMQFGGGTRVCVGEAFAQKRLFIFLASMLQSFDLVAADNPLVPCDHDSHLQGGILVHRPYTIKLVPRQLAK